MNLTQQKAQFEIFLRSLGDEPRAIRNIRKNAFNNFGLKSNIDDQLVLEQVLSWLR